LVADITIATAKSLFAVFSALGLTAILLWIERKGSALIHDRIGANRAAIIGFLPFNLGFVNTLLADPIKLFTKEDFVPDGADRFLHAMAPFLALVPVLVVFAAIPFVDTLEVAGRQINLQAAPLDIGILYILAMVSLSVYGIVLGGWASNNRWALLGGIRGSALMISYELAMGLAIVGTVMTYGTLNLQDICRAQGELIFGFIPAWGIIYQPIGFIVLLIAGMVESKRVPFDQPEGESEIVAGYFTEYSGSKQAAFMFTDFAEIAVVAALVTTLFFGGWQVPYLQASGFVFPGGLALPLPHLLVVLMQLAAYMTKVLFFCAFQILVRWTMPRYRYDQVMSLGWKRLLPLALLNVVATAVVIVVAGT